MRKSPDGWLDGHHISMQAGTPIVLLEYDLAYSGFLIGLVGDIYVRVHPHDLIPSESV